MFLQLGYSGMCVEENSKTDKGITLLSSETLCIFLTCMFRNYPLGEESRGLKGLTEHVHE